uniref:Uncharacterized protein n=1 Tax=Setaria italica TaxID=4555 RepID=K3ZBL4_SETIT
MLVGKGCWSVGSQICTANSSCISTETKGNGGILLYKPYEERQSSPLFQDMGHFVKHESIQFQV